MFRHKAQRFAEQLVTEVFSSREGAAPGEPSGDPPTVPRALKESQPQEPVQEEARTSPSEPQAYRDESRISEFGELWFRWVQTNIYYVTIHLV